MTSSERVAPPHHVIDVDDSPRMTGVIPGATGNMRGGRGDRHGASDRFGNALDHQVQILLSGESDHNEAHCPDKKQSVQAAAARPLPEQVDALEVALAMAFRQHRHKVEEILEEHWEAMEVYEGAQKLEVSKLRAENAMLRERLGLGPTAEPQEMYQTVALHEATKQVYTAASGAKGAKAGAGGAKAGTDNRRKNEDDDGEGDSLRIKRGNKDNKNMPTGSWQQFVAWVPAGSALNAPQPWQPIPTDTFQPVANHIGNMKRGAGNVGTTLGGTYTDGNVDDSCSEGSDASKKRKKVRFKVVDVFVATQDELEASRQNMHAKKMLQKEERKHVGSIVQAVQNPHEPAGDEENFFSDQRGDWWIVHPHSNKRIAWDLSSLTLVVWDMISIPMSAFSMPESLFLKFMEWTTRIFWTMDMGMSMVTGVTLKDGSVQLEFRYILRRYFTSWFALDIFIVASDWIEYMADGATGPFSFLRSLRTVRVVRLMRLVRMKEVMAQFTERVQSEKLSFVIKVLQMCVFVVSIGHITACGWWGLGDRQTGGATWVRTHNYENMTLDSQYLASLHWSLSQFSGGMDEITPAGALERLYAVAMWLFAFMSTAVVVSILTSNLTQMHIIGGSRARQFATLRKYLKQNSVSSNLALRMQRSAQHALSADLTADVVELLPVVSEPLRVEMHFEMYTSVLNNHAFFQAYSQECPQVMRRVCHYAMNTLLLANGDVIFSKGESPSHPKMYFVVKGNCEYSPTHTGESVVVGEKQSIAEAVLWTRWTHQGTLTAISDVKLMCMDAKVFQEISDRFRDSALFDPKLYAADFVAMLNSTELVTDLSSLKYKGLAE